MPKFLPFLSFRRHCFLQLIATLGALGVPLFPIAARNVSFYKPRCVTPEIDEFADCLRRTTLCHPPFFGHLLVFHFTPACIVQAWKSRARNAETLSAETLSTRACPMPQTCGVNADVRREREGEGEGNRGRQKSLIRNGFGFKGPCSVRTSYRGPL